MKRRYCVLLVPLCSFLLALGQEAVKPVFVDVTKQAGISFTHCLGDDEINTIVEATGSGCAFMDYDGDGFMDIYAVNGCYLEGVNDPESRFKGQRLTDHLFRNRGNGTFEDVTEKAGVGDPRYGMGITRSCGKRCRLGESGRILPMGAAVALAGARVPVLAGLPVPQAGQRACHLPLPPMDSTFAGAFRERALLSPP